jgi:hypothetical protein
MPAAVFVEVLLQIVVTRGLVFLGTFFVHPDPSAAFLHETVTHFHLEHGVDGGEGLAILMVSSNVRASLAFSTGVFQFLTTYFGPRTTWAGFTSRNGPASSQSNSIRNAEGCCLTVGG